MSVIPSQGKLRQEDPEFELYSKKTKQTLISFLTSVRVGFANSTQISTYLGRRNLNKGIDSIRLASRQACGASS